MDRLGGIESNPSNPSNLFNSLFPFFLNAKMMKLKFEKTNELYIDKGGLFIVSKINARNTY